MRRLPRDGDGDGGAGYGDERPSDVGISAGRFEMIATRTFSGVMPRDAGVHAESGSSEATAIVPSGEERAGGNMPRPVA
jgi:hypothetical protein